MQPLRHDRRPGALDWSVGCARTDITAYEPGQLLFGWGDDRGRAGTVGSRLHARAIVIRPTQETITGTGAVAIACLDLVFISALLRESVLDRLVRSHPDVRLRRCDVLISATHTHSAPAGLTDSPLYEMMNYGFSPDVFDHVVARTADALAAAWREAKPARLRVAQVDAPESARWAVNRSMRAHRHNPEAQPGAVAAAAVDRTMTVLRVEDADGLERGMVSWHGMHGTSIHAGQTALHPDHKGVAAGLLEARRCRAGSPGYVAIFAQGAAGDVTPNHRWCRQRKRAVGLTDDDQENCLRLAEQQVELAERALRLARGSAPLSGALGGRMRITDLERTEVHPRFTLGMGPTRTRAATLGMGFVSGTREGPGPLGSAGHTLRLLGRSRRRRHLRREERLPAHRRVDEDPMVPFGRLGRGVHGELLGLPIVQLLPRLARADPTFAWLYAAHRSTRTLDRPWLSGRAPAQLLQVGSLVIVAVPAEPTTVAGRRLRDTVGERMPGTEMVVIAGYANGYTGYVTTPEEYIEQGYEGGSTLFGRWTLGAWQTVLEDVAGQSIDAGMVPGPPLEHADVATLTREREAGRAGMGRFAARVAAQRHGVVLGRS